MVHLGKMHVEAALFFETVEEIYARVFRLVRPRTTVPKISVEFRHYANANSKIRLSEAGLAVKISDLLQPAPAPIQEALAWILLCKLFGKQPEEETVALYQRYLNRTEVRHKLTQARRQRGRKSIQPPAGSYFDLRLIFARLNRDYFNGGLREPVLGWSLRDSRTTLGHYDPAHHAIVISRALDRPGTPPLIVDYVMYHEMLHILHPVEVEGHKRRIHTPGFKEAEQKFSGYAEARKQLRMLASRS